MLNKFTENFIDLCSEKKLNQSDISKEIGINQSQVSRYYKGVLPDIKNVVKICDYFNCSIDYIIGFTDERNYKNITKGFTNLVFFSEYEKLLKQNNTTHYSLAKKKIVCETSFRLWKKEMLPNFEVLCNIAFALGSSVDKLLGRILKF